MRVHRWAAFAVPCMVVSLFLVLGPVHLHQARAAGAEEQRLLELINGYRQENGVGPLVTSGVLSTSAQRHSEDMAAHDFFSHSTRESSYYPGGSGPADRAAREGYPTNVYTAENIALGQQTAEEVFGDWRGSLEHNAAMLGEQYTATGIGHVDPYWTADFGSVADTPLDLGTLEPYAGRIVESATGEQSSTPASAAEQTTGEREGDEQTTDDERTPEDQAQLEGTQPEAQDVTVENEPAAGETATTQRITTPQQATTVQAPDGTAPTTEDTPDPWSNEETTLGIVSSPRPPTEGTGAEQYAIETTLADILSPSGEELAIENLDAGTIAQEAVTEEGFHRVSTGETEAIETALATREDVPEDMVWQAPSVPEQPTGGPAADQSPPAFGLGASGGGGVAGLTPLATKELPETSDASPLTLFLGGFLLLCGFLVFGAARKQRGS
jgi:LPXTG-motif cell wall-anchored protein